MVWNNVFRDSPIKSITTKNIRKAVNTFANEYMPTRDGSAAVTNKKRSSNTVVRYKAVLSSIFITQKEYIKDKPVNDVFAIVNPNIVELQV